MVEMTSLKTKIQQTILKRLDVSMFRPGQPTESLSFVVPIFQFHPALHVFIFEKETSQDGGVCHPMGVKIWLEVSIIDKCR